MRKFVLLLFFIFIFVSDNIVNGTTGDELLDIVEVAESENLLIDEWEIVYRDKVNEHDMPSMLQFFHAKNSTKKILNQHIMYTATETITNPKMTVTYTFIMPKENDFQPQLTVTLQGKKWDHTDASAVIRQKNELLKQFITNSPSIFTCLSAKDNAIIENGISMNKMSTGFNVLHSFTQIDNNEQSKYVGEIYGYNPDWNNTLHIDGDPVNIHIVLKRDEHETNFVTIGTPIILNEY